MAKDRVHIHIDFGADDEARELLDNLNKYINLLGITKKRMFLMGCAMVIGKNEDNPDLIMQIFKYMEGRK